MEVIILKSKTQFPIPNQFFSHRVEKNEKSSMKWLPTLSASTSELSPPVKSCPIKKLALLDPKFHFLESDPLFAQLWLPEIIQVLKIELLFNLPTRDLGIGSHQP